MNKIEELEQRCEQLEDRVEALEKALVAALARPEKTAVNREAMLPAFQIPFPPLSWASTDLEKFVRW